MIDLSSITIPIKKHPDAKEYTAQEWLERIVEESILNKGNYWINCNDFSILIAYRLSCYLMRFENHSVAFYNGWFIDPQCNSYIKTNRIPITPENVHRSTIIAINAAHPIRNDLIYRYYASKPEATDLTFLKMVYI